MTIFIILLTINKIYVNSSHKFMEEVMSIGWNVMREGGRITHECVSCGKEWDSVIIEKGCPFCKSIHRIVRLADQEICRR